jgi:flagellar motor switch protein FliN
MDAAEWVGRLESEIGRELGQAVMLVAGGEGPQPGGEMAVVLEVPEARLTLAAGMEGLTALMIEARLIEREQADVEAVRELWAGILSSVAARLGGRSAEGAAGAEGVPCTLRLGAASVGMSLRVEAAARAAAAEPRQRPEQEVLPGRSERGAAPGETSNYDLLFELELDAVVRFGSRDLELREVLELGPGDVVELDRQLTDPVDLIVGDKIVARGEVVLVNGNFGLRVTEVAEPRRRLESIRCLG